ncbi:MAG: beta-galactosidase, partial [Ignavibacteriaceae bacterium]
MKNFLLLFIVSTFLYTSYGQSGNGFPHLQKQGTATQLVVHGKPFLILGGELGNSTASNLDYLKPYWENLKKLNLNTILAPVYWELMEPAEGKFDFSLIDGLIKDARENNIKLVLLWFGSWKNSMSCYAPEWVKKDIERFPRALDINGMGKEILTSFSSNNLEADKKAFVMLMKHLKEIDSDNNTVIMVQVENEIGMIPDARDYYGKANEAFKSEVPAELTGYLKEHKENLIPEFLDYWKGNGYETSGTWEEIFGKSLKTDEVFMAWQYSKYVEEIT